jgi:type II secretory pathway component GspD/PulD (secretin)
MKKFLAMIALFALVAAPLMAGDDEASYRKIENQLDSTTIETLAYEEADVTEVIKDIAKKARITIVIDKKALEDVDESDREVTLELADIKASNALNIVVDQIGLFKTYKNGVLYITTEDKANEETVTKTYDVRDITVTIADFPAPKLRLKPADDNSQGPTIEIPREDDPDTDDVIEMVEESIDADWGDTASVSKIKGQLIVRAPRKIHKEVAELLDQLRAAK